MQRKTIRLGGLLRGVAIAPSALPPSPAPSEVLPFAKPSIAEPSDPIPATDPAEILAVRTMLAELGRVVEKLRTQQHAAIEKVAQTTVELGVALAERLVKSEIASDRQRLDRIVRDALEHMTAAPAITVRGHADDLALLQRQLAEQREIVGSTLTFRPEKGCERGQVKIEADDWFIDFDTQRSLTELRDRLLEETFANE
jgi:flagellar biosynthesis/type III secretory pathway protein FliH